MIKAIFLIAVSILLLAGAYSLLYNTTSLGKWLEAPAPRTFDTTRVEIANMYRYQATKDLVLLPKRGEYNGVDEVIPRMYQDSMERIKKLGTAEENYNNLLNLGTGRQLPASSFPEVANLEDFRLIESNEKAGEFKFQLDAREKWQALFTNESDYEVKVLVTASGKACPGSPDPCSGPNGLFGPAKYSRHEPGQFPFGEAMAYALIGRVNDSIFQIGEKRIVTIPPHSTLEGMTNIRWQYLDVASGGYVATVTQLQTE